MTKKVVKLTQQQLKEFIRRTAKKVVAERKAAKAKQLKEAAQKKQAAAKPQAKTVQITEADLRKMVRKAIHKKLSEALDRKLAENKSKFKFKTDSVVYSDDLYYDLIDSGRIDPDNLLSDPGQAAVVKHALDLIGDFLNQAEKAGAINAPKKKD